MALHEIQNNFFQLTVSPDEGMFSLQSKRVGLASFTHGHIKVSLLKGKKQFSYYQVHGNRIS